MISELSTSTTNRDNCRNSEVRSFSKKADIASLRIPEIAQMTSEELLNTIRSASSLLQGRSLNADLDATDRTILEKLVHKARRSCRNQGY